MTAVTRSDSAKCAMTLPSLSFFASSLASTHGSVSSIYLFVRLINFHIAVNPTENCISSSASSTCTVASMIDCSSSRSEEHTSELQSRGHLVCRLLLEQKKHHHSF